MPRAPSAAAQCRVRAVPHRAAIAPTAPGPTTMMGQALMDYIAPAEVARLIREKIVMAPRTTECTVPAGIFKGEGSMLNFIAYGDELNLVHPPRPKNPKQTWEQQYAVKVRLKSTGMTM